MQVKASTKCPICGEVSKCTFFHMQANKLTKLRFKCKNCSLTFLAYSSKYYIDKKKRTIYFDNIFSPDEIIWSIKGEKFNPSER